MGVFIEGLSQQPNTTSHQATRNQSEPDSLETLIDKFFGKGAYKVGMIGALTNYSDVDPKDIKLY